MTNIILCGGSGTRLWPLSRTLMPKQFVKLFDGESLFQKTVERNRHICDGRTIVSNAEQYFLAVDQLEEMAASQKPDGESSAFLLEPVGRNTAPAVALACLALDPGEVVLVTPSDHLIKKTSEYAKALEQAEVLAEKGFLVTFGITPTFPETGFGYIEAGRDNGVAAFHEKPDFETAKRYLEKGNCYWNSGMFMFRAGVFLEELERYAPELHAASKTAFEQAVSDGKLLRITHEAMAKIPEDSIDYAVMEKSEKVKVVPSDIGWSDLGSFDALYEELPKDDEGNAMLSAENAAVPVVQGSGNNLVVSDKLVALVDVDDLIVVDTADALLVSRKGSSQKVRNVVKRLREQGSGLPDIHVTAHRPWGAYTVLDESGGYKVKRIVVKPGKRLSLQKHFHRSEHWIVVSGTALVTKGGEEFLVRANESTYIPMGEIHRLENVGKIPLVMIEAQVGEYVGEDDIVRIEDDYAR